MKGKPIQYRRSLQFTGIRAHKDRMVFKHCHKYQTFLEVPGILDARIQEQREQKETNKKETLFATSVYVIE